MWIYRHSLQEVCPWNHRFAEVAVERDHAARETRDAAWDAEDVSAETSGGPGAGDDAAPLPPALSDEDQVVAEVAAWALRQVALA